jgi:hypothetical protein
MLLVGLGAIGQAEGLAARIKGRRPTDPNARHALLLEDR